MASPSMRLLAEDEGRLLSHLATAAGIPVDPSLLRAQPLADGGMGSFRLSSTTGVGRFVSAVAEVTFEDEDGVPVLATLYLDEAGAPFEIDVWKVDFSPRRRWPGLLELARSRAL